MYVSIIRLLKFDTIQKGSSVIYGYCRVSTHQQNIERQIRNILTAYPEAKIYQEAYTGVKIDRPEFSKLLRRVTAGDSIVFDSVSRMSRDAEEGAQLYEELFLKGVDLIFLKEPHVDTTVYREAVKAQLTVNLDTGNTATDELVATILDALNKYSIALAKQQIRLAFAQAQKEVDDLHQRVKEGMVTARLNGKQIGQRKGNTLHIKKKAPTKEIILKHCKDFGGTLSDEDCRTLAKISRNTYYKYKRELKSELSK